MLVRHFMSTNVFTLPPETTVIEALRTLRRKRIRHAPILDEDDELLGIVTERDLLKATPGTVAELDTPTGRAACARHVIMVASTSIVTAHPNDHIEDVARVFIAKRIGGMPVVENGRVIGMITETDVFRSVVGDTCLSDTTRVTVQRSQKPVVKPVLDVVESLGLELAGMTEYGVADGREVVVLRLRGSAPHELDVALTHAGWVLLERRWFKPAI